MKTHIPMNRVLPAVALLAVGSLFLASSHAAETRPGQPQADAEANRVTSMTPPPADSTTGTGTARTAGTATAGSIGANSDHSADRSESIKQVNDAWAWFDTLQKQPASGVSNSVVSLAKAVVFVDRWSGSAIVGGTGGKAIAYRKASDGTWRGPVFYNVAGGSVGAQVGGSHVRSVAFLMSDKALQTLTDSKFIWSGNLRAVAGNDSAVKTTIDNTVDVILYQTASGLDVGAAVSATKLTPDDDRNRGYYDSTTITPAEIYSSTNLRVPGAKVLPPPFGPLPR